MTYDDNVKRWKKAYTAILEVTDEYHDFCSLYGFNDINEIRLNAKSHLLLIDWYEQYGLKIRHDNKSMAGKYLRRGDYLAFSHFEDAEADKERGKGKFISWSDDGRQPNNEWLLVTNFPTGAYIFGDDYDAQKGLFNDLIQEIKGYNPDYSDTANKSFYWKLENAKPIYDSFDGILSKYHKRNKSELNSRKADKLRKELAKLEITERDG